MQKAIFLHFFGFSIKKDCLYFVCVRASMCSRSEKNMTNLHLYLFCFIPLILILGAYCLLRFVFKNKLKNYDTVMKWFVRGLAIMAGVCTFACIYFIQSVMITAHGEDSKHFDINVGCVQLVGQPYGSRKFLNFLALLSIWFIYPTIFIIVLETFFNFKVGKLFNRFIALPIIALTSLTIFHFKNALLGVNGFDYRIIFIGLALGSSLSLSLIKFYKDLIDKLKVSNWKEIGYLFAFFAIILCCFMPPQTLAVLFRTDGFLFGTKQTLLEAQDFKIYHRFLLYINFAVPLVIYFANRGQDLNTRKVVLIAASLGALTSFTAFYTFDQVFPIVDGRFTVKVNSLPIHLCHTALYVVPICVAFDFKRLFYFTYFINVFGALMAMLWPNVGEGSNVFTPGDVMFWYNHMSAFSAPLLAVALGAFEKPKFKQMLWSLLFFGIYFFGVMFLNGWLSNYVEGYNPATPGSGTDYLFINGDYILGNIFGEKAKDMLNIKLQWQIGKLSFVYYPLYQSLFFIGYVGIAFGMWFIYSLFFRIADAHNDLHNRLVILRKQHIHLKERVRMEKISNDVNLHAEAKLKFIDFCKRYGNSERLSADHVNLEVKGGQIFGFLGPNGAGKSTCIKTTIGIQPVTDGHIEVCGYDVTTQSVQCKKCIGYVPDHYALYEKLTGREYINYIADLYGVSKEDRDVRIARYIDLFELTQAFDNRMQTYSHGMKQKMTIIAALVHNPKVWILDEPLTGLDPQSIYQVKECMKLHASQGNIVFFSSHIIDVVEKLCTDIAIIKKGQIVYKNTMENVLKEHPEGLEEFYMNTIRDNGDLDE